jgi:hypothetical protein
LTPRQNSPRVIDPVAPAPYVHPLDAVVWQDGLLQAYRSFHLVLQSIFSAVGVGLTTAVISFDNPLKARLTFLVLSIVGAVSLAMLFRLRRVIQARAEDVYYWQQELIRAEFASNSERYFSRFKVAQILKDHSDLKLDGLVSANNLTEEQIRQLVEHSHTNMREVLDRTYTWAIVLLWLAFFIASAAAAWLR